METLLALLDSLLLTDDEYLALAVVIVQGLDNAGNKT